MQRHGYVLYFVCALETKAYMHERKCEIVFVPVYLVERNQNTLCMQKHIHWIAIESNRAFYHCMLYNVHTINTFWNALHRKRKTHTQKTASPFYEDGCVVFFARVYFFSCHFFSIIFGKFLLKYIQITWIQRWNIFF